MRKLLIVFLLSTISGQVFAETGSKIKVLGTMAIYGTVGGALLGTASLAFGTKPRSIAVGASLGLYAGILFGGYVVASYAMKNSNWNMDENYYPDATSPYEDPEAFLKQDNLQKYESKFLARNYSLSLPLVNYQF